MIDLTTLSAAQLATAYNATTGKSVKPSSYPKAKFISMIAIDLNKLGRFGLGTNDDNAICPHCGINHIDNGWQEADSLLEDNGAVIDRQFICLACNSTWGPLTATTPTGSTFTMAEAARAAGVSSKIARARYRAVDNDGVKTRYVFDKSRWDAVLLTISPKRKGR